MFQNTPKINPPAVPEIRRIKRWIWIFLLISLIGMAASAWVGFYKKYHPDPAYVQLEKLTKRPMTVKRHVQINSFELWIPAPYFFLGIPSEIKTKDVLLTAMFPDFSPVMESPNALRKRDEWYKNVTWLIQDASTMKGLQEALTSNQKSLQASAFIDMQYGLHHYSQPKDVKNDNGYLWVEKNDGQVISFIKCGKKHTQITQPQCSHYVWDQGALYKIGYDQRLLPKWKDIRIGVLGLTETFKIKPEFSSTISNQGE